MRRGLLFLPILLAALLGISWAHDGEWRLKIVMMGVGVLFATPIVAALARKAKRKGRRLYDADLHLSSHAEQPDHFEKPSTHHPHIPEKW